MKKFSFIIGLILGLFCTLNNTLAYYNTNSNLTNNFYTKKYNLNINGNGGTFSNGSIIVKQNKATLPTPTKYGYEFLGYKDNNNVNYSTTINNVDDINNKSLSAKWNATTYSISYNLNGGNANTKNNYTVESNFTLPIPTREGYIFDGWTGTGLTTPTKNVTISNSIGNRSYTANWTKNVFTVNYYVNGSLWTQRSVAYNNNVENLNAQSLLDIYHTFHGWNGWVDKMPNHDVNLYANITESYCALITGHGPYANASGLLSVFQSAGWTGRIEEAPSAPGQYWVVTDYTLTRAQAEQQKQYIASHTNYTSYNYPYLYWVSVSCTNGYSEAWTRGLGQSTFN